MARPDHTAAMGVRAVASRLDLPASKVRAAMDAGLLGPVTGGTVGAAFVDAAAADREQFLTDLAEVTPVDLAQAARLLRLRPAAALAALEDAAVPTAGHQQWRAADVRALAATSPARTQPAPTPAGRRVPGPGRSPGTNRPSGRSGADRSPAGTAVPTPPAAALSGISDGQDLRIRVVSGVPGPAVVTIHAGPTNSGKTFDALNALAAAGRGVYAGPLRMLAREAHTKLSTLVGADNVGLITGEEQENPDAPIICATVEAAPLRHGGILVLDECHWLSDPARGWAWTRALIASTFDEVHAITDPAAADLIRALVPDAGRVTRVDHPRLAGLQFAGETTLADAPVGSAVVVFSRAAVLAVADALTKAGRTPAVLYGALPPAARAAQVERLVSGQADVIVTTDVIGHGINLPLTAVVLAETVKFDGTERRPLLLWEAAQVLGRAGRYGLGSAVGQTFTLTGVPWFTCDSDLVEHATLAAAGKVSTGWTAPERAAVRPTLGELGAVDVRGLPAAVSAFTVTTRRAADVVPVAAFDDSPVQARLAGLLAVPGAADVLGVQAIWGLAMCPVDDVPLIADVAGALVGPGSARDRLRSRAIAAQDAVGGLEDAEKAAGIARNLRAVTRAVGDLPGVSMADAARWEDDAAAAVCSALDVPGAMAGYGSCARCGRSCAPWFPTCQSCHSRGQDQAEDRRVPAARPSSRRPTRRGSRGRR